MLPESLAGRVFRNSLHPEVGVTTLRVLVFANDTSGLGIAKAREGRRPHVSSRKSGRERDVSYKENRERKMNNKGIFFGPVLAMTKARLRRASASGT